MQGNRPLFSICVAVYNLENYIAECLDSILLQSFDDYELLVADNGSTDRSVEICEKYARRYPGKMKFTVLPQPTIFGRAQVFNLLRASGKYWLDMDGDDYIAAGCLKEVAAIIEAHNPDIVMGSFIGVAEEGLTPHKDVFIDPDKVNAVPYTQAVRYLMSIPYLAPSNWRFFVRSYKVSTAGQISIKVYGINNGEMYHMLKRFLTNSSIYYYQTPFYYYRRRPNCITLTKNSYSVSDYIKAPLLGNMMLRCYLAPEQYDEYFAIFAPFVKRYLRIFLGDADVVVARDFMDLASRIDEFGEDFLMFRHYKYHLFDLLVDFVQQYGSLQGLITFCEYERSLLLAKLGQAAGKELYIFPTGGFGEGAGRILDRFGVEYHGYLDNSSAKDGTSIQGHICRQPDMLRTFDERQKQNTVVLIATVYDQMVPVFKEQLLSLGLSEQQIIVRE